MPELQTLPCKMMEVEGHVYFTVRFYPTFLLHYSYSTALLCYRNQETDQAGMSRSFTLGLCDSYSDPQQTVLPQSQVDPSAYSSVLEILRTFHVCLEHDAANLCSVQTTNESQVV